MKVEKRAFLRASSCCAFETGVDSLVSRGVDRECWPSIIPCTIAISESCCPVTVVAVLCRAPWGSDGEGGSLV